MPYFKSSQEWLEQSTLLLEARPSTPVKSRKRKADDTDGDTPVNDAPKPPRGSLVIKTYDPVSGVTLKYRTTKAAEVSRLVYSSLGRLGRSMAAVPLDVPEEAMPDASGGGGGADGGDGDNKGSGAATPASQQPQGQQAQQGGGKKKKKGRK
ncbi:Signal recognition particle, SRP9 subunit [Metarhizium robertsii ARSEF 23]|uniref:Signal recognition particle, SRP9 subunit n=1 Tax=Metarhizium robertsii (strain ARSEF 23 / ATCC MYA-3075) TaxID=655844 RepID=E9EUA2_METRA|nr:Signal recognition particle, SRP9 subunit [Metarhizium robertsii ARSEF 23]EFZ01005.1 Signal recognition particle, SRP9 subunit [Metarhizium robertsii ARSEF 23]